MPIDIERFNKRREEEKAGRPAKKDRPGFWKPKEPGHHCIYVCPPNSLMDSDPYIRLLVHYGVGAEDKMHTCLSLENAVLWAKPVQDAIRKRNDDIRADHPDWVLELSIDDGCPTCDAIADEKSGLDPKKAERMEQKETFVFSVIPWWYADLKGKRMDGTDTTRVIRPWLADEKRCDEVCDFITANRVDITDPAAAVLVQIKRTGTGFKDTRYATSLDLQTSQKPLRMPPPIRALLRTLEPGEENDPHALVAGLTRSAATIRGWLGGETATSDETQMTSAGPPPCFKRDCNPDDAYCQSCPYLEPCAKFLGIALDGKGNAEPEEDPEHEEQVDRERKAGARTPDKSPAAEKKVAAPAKKEPEPAIRQNKPSDPPDDEDPFEAELRRAMEEGA